MKLKRLAASISAGFEDFVSRVENHEAVAEQVLAEVRASAARIKAQVMRIETQLARIDERRERLSQDRDRWHERALRFAAADEQRALECVARLTRCEEGLLNLARERKELADLGERLRANLRDVEQRLHDLTLRKSTLSSRSARAQALRAFDADGAVDELERVFERWEINVSADEYATGPAAPDVDGLDRELSEAERREALVGRLAELRRSVSESREES